MYPRGPPGQLRSGGGDFLWEIPYPRGKLSNFRRGRGGAMGRGSFHAKVLVLFIKNGRLNLRLNKKKYIQKLALLVACNWLKKQVQL